MGNANGGGWLLITVFVGNSRITQPKRGCTNIGWEPRPDSPKKPRIAITDPMNLTDDENRPPGKFDGERCPFAPALKTLREVLAKVDPSPSREPPPR